MVLIRLPQVLQHVDVPRFCAIIIGIDSYILSPLRGCVSDALLVKCYLTEVLGVLHIQSFVSSKNRILRDDRRTHADVIGALLGLATNSSIQNGNSMIIHITRYGSSYCPLKHGVTECYVMPKHNLDSIEALCPTDRGMNGMNGGTVPDISDWELNAIFAQISEAKGHQITVTVDCCYSSPFTSCWHEGVHMAPLLFHKSLNDVVCAADEDLKCYPTHYSVLLWDLYPDIASYVILAA